MSIKQERCEKITSGPRQHTNRYFLVVEGIHKPVRQKMFLSILGIPDRQVTTMLQKKNSEGVVASEGRGGYLGTRANEASIETEKIKDHINRFPRIESHYKRKSTSRHYLAPELTVAKMYEMYEMYKTENADRKNVASYEKYFKIFKTLNLSFFVPKKDQCGLCVTFRESNEVSNDVETKYYDHIAQKEKTRNDKTASKQRAAEETTHASFAFDLEQVIFLPQSNRSEILYKRRFSNYNFTIYNLHSKDAWAFVWHECIAGRGANEVASCVHQYLKKLDADGCESVDMFCDGCAGQNKNSILPAMMLHVIENSKNIKSIRLIILVPHHSQNENDCIHSCVERAIKRAGNLTVPSQLTPVIRCSRKKSLNVVEITTDIIRDWHKLSTDLGIRTENTNKRILATNPMAKNDPN